MQWTVKDVAKLLRISEKTVYRWISQGSLPVHRVQEQYRFEREELLEWAATRKLPVAIELLQGGEDEEPLPDLVEALRAGGVIHGLACRDRESALRSLVEALRLPEEVDRDFLHRVLLAREVMQPTCIGGGIALPHARNPVVLHAHRPTVTLAFLEAPVDFGALDGQPVHTLFAVVSPSLRAHLHLMARVCHALGLPSFRARVEGRASRDEVLAAAADVEQELARRSAPPPDRPGRSTGS